MTIFAPSVHTLLQHLFNEAVEKEYSHKHTPESYNFYGYWKHLLGVFASADALTFFLHPTVVCALISLFKKPNEELVVISIEEKVKKLSFMDTSPLETPDNSDTFPASATIYESSILKILLLSINDPSQYLNSKPLLETGINVDNISPIMEKPYTESGKF